MTAVLVTGANGYISQHIIQLLLQQNYTVVGTVRSVAKKEKYAALFSSCNLTIEVVPKLDTPHAFDFVFGKHRDITVVLHVATPVKSYAVNYDSEIISPAINGTTYLLESIRDVAPQVTRVVYTSSVAALAHPSVIYSTRGTFSERDWNQVTYEQSKESPRLAYYYAKRIAEQTAWEFANSRVNFSLSTVLPGGTFGPLVFDSDVADPMPSTSDYPIRLLKLRRDDPIPEFGAGFIDVRDLAQAHILVMESEAARGKRVVVEAEMVDNHIMLDIIRRNFPQFRDKLPECNPDSSQFIEPDIAQSRKILSGLEFTPISKTVVDAVTQVLRARESDD
ncbi:uncharacterized protein SPAPADRAFT_153619 [Spathaspora passalidarum NRRL Y-27907]|uniref:NAD-dependent epimerase/dehydratase domain-containing protein n=1 Tax=Spathaspora passalidarum (strain NRRL Y-27907 / 11-Y1) TaxID=619300 RepID=G3ANL5_SPAPN|nr:uncharacterized protein SPAPADRAFT_153619 [Spathaspora passalidarum NRRL Y-27907]EGW32543.1 hypothetical protein SPAPADRAFT_153619 [Spathaspora passalidarum NRRL Y-27907]